MRQCGQYFIDIAEPDESSDGDLKSVMVIRDRDDYILSLENEGLFLIITTTVRDGEYMDEEVRRSAHIIGVDEEYYIINTQDINMFE